MARVLLLVPAATYRVADFLEAARTLGVEVVIGGDEAHALQDLMGRRSVQLPLDDPVAAAEMIVAHDEVAPLDAVIAVDDRGAVAAAEASQRLGLRHNPPDAVAATRDKLVMRTRLGRAEVPQPAFTSVAGDAAPEDVTRLLGGVGLPCVVKPRTLSASQGVLRADTAEEAVAAVERVRRIVAGATGTPDAALLLERFVPGPEVAVEGLLTDGVLSVLAVFDKPDPLEGPAFEETIYVTPSRLDAADTSAAVAAAAAACRALGLAEGPVHAEVRVHEGRASVIEVAARTIGGLCARTLTFSTGRTLEQLVIAQALGRPLGATRRRTRASGVLMIPIPRAGILEGVGGRDLAARVPGITDIQITIAPGRPVVPVPEGDRYLGFVFARGRSPADVEAALRQAQALLDVRIAPDPDVATTPTGRSPC
ncbi:MAG TPA: ATP-grasp domain-containing protein [Acidimicrobiales bacterium]|nr:ATP-grasp domain-containing protein [Acidimicrobiales bacterium]